MPITIGPVIDITPGMLPDWAVGWRGDLPTLAAFMCDFLETVIGRYCNYKSNQLMGVNLTAPVVQLQVPFAMMLAVRRSGVRSPAPC